MSFRPSPPWFKNNRQLASKLQRKRRIQAKGLAPIPQSKAAQRELADQLAAELVKRMAWRG